MSTLPRLIDAVIQKHDIGQPKLVLQVQNAEGKTAAYQVTLNHGDTVDVTITRLKNLTQWLEKLVELSKT